jgi:hypothetical protein
MTALFLKIRKKSNIKFGKTENSLWADGAPEAPVESGAATIGG